MSYHGPWNSQLVTQRQKASELTLLTRKPVPKLQPSKVGDVLILARYLQNLQNSTSFEAPEGELRERQKTTQRPTVRITAVVWMRDFS
jgi:hypothetical protein